MTTEAVIKAVSTLGISVVMCILCAWFVKYMFDRFMKSMEDDRVRNSEQLNTLKDALNNNTVALTKIAERLEINDSKN